MWEDGCKPKQCNNKVGGGGGAMLELMNVAEVTQSLKWHYIWAVKLLLCCPIIHISRWNYRSGFGWPKSLLSCVGMEDLLMKWPEDVLPMGVSSAYSSAKSSSIYHLPVPPPYILLVLCGSPKQNLASPQCQSTNRFS